jgi:hypothetical protein
MIDLRVDAISVRPHDNDLVACRLLKNIDRYEQFAILYSIDTDILKRVFNAAFELEEYEICQVIKEVLEERTMLAEVSYAHTR